MKWSELAAWGCVKKFSVLSVLLGAGAKRIHAGCKPCTRLPLPYAGGMTNCK